MEYMCKIICIVQARMSSTRLPNKVLMELGGKPVLSQVINQLSFSKKINQIIVATSTSKEDDAIIQWAKQNKIDYFRGDLDDVLKRFYDTAKYFQADIIVRITADCPLIDPEIVDEVIKQYIKTNSDYVSNTNPPRFPDGLDTEVFSFYALESAYKNASLKSEREHVTPFIRNNPTVFKIGNYEIEKNYESMRWTLDNTEDYHFLKNIYNRLIKYDDYIHWQDVISLLDNKPDIMNINSHLTRNEGYQKSLIEDKNQL